MGAIPYAPEISGYYGYKGALEAASPTGEYVWVNGYAPTTGIGGCIYKNVTTDVDAYAAEGKYFRHEVVCANDEKYQVWAPDGWAAAEAYGARPGYAEDPEFPNNLTYPSNRAAVQRAFDSGLNISFGPGYFKLENWVEITKKGQKIRGAGREKSFFYIAENYSGNQYVFRVCASSVTIEDMGWQYNQDPDITNRNNLVTFPTAIDVRGLIGPVASPDGNSAERCAIRRVRVQGGATHGIRLYNNCGGLVLEDVELGTLTKGVYTNQPHWYCADSIYMTNVRIWPYGYPGGDIVSTVFVDGDNIGFHFQRCDDLHLQDITPWRTRMIFDDVTIQTDDSPVEYVTAGSFGEANNISFDGSFARLEFNAGKMAFNNAYFTTKDYDSEDFFIHQTGGELQFHNFRAPVRNLSSVAFKCTGGKMVIGNAVLTNLDDPYNSNVFRVEGSGKMMIHDIIGVMDNSTPNDRSTPMVEQDGANSTLYCTNFCLTDNTKSGNFIKLNDDGNHMIIGNNVGGGSLSFVNMGKAAVAANNA